MFNTLNLQQHSAAHHMQQRREEEFNGHQADHRQANDSEDALKARDLIRHREDPCRPEAPRYEAEKGYRNQEDDDLGNYQRFEDAAQAFLTEQEKPQPAD